MNRAGSARTPSTRAIVTMPASIGSAQGVERVRAELERLVQEQGAAMREARLARPDAGPAADERLGRDRVVRCPERPPQAEPRARVVQASDRVDPADLGRLAVVEERQQAGGRARQQRLADARRPGEGDVVPAGDRDLQGAARDDLPDHRREVGRVIELRGRSEGRPRRRRRAPRGRRGGA